MVVQKERIQNLNSKDILTDGLVLYFMDRDRRINDNWALIHAKNMADEMKVELHILYVLPPKFLNSALRQHDFMIKGLQECASDAEKLGIKFVALGGDPAKEVTRYVNENGVGFVVTDFSPLKLPRSWRDAIANDVKCKMVEVDAHNVVPCFHVSDKVEFAAHTLRPKINKKLDEFLVDFPDLKKCKVASKPFKIDWDEIWDSLQIDEKVEPVDWIKPGEKAAIKAMIEFLGSRIDEYEEKRNDPNAGAISDLSPYFHYGQLSTQRVALECKALPPKVTESFLEEMIVRKELADNFCYYNKDYDNFKGFHEWAQKSLNEHCGDKRDYVYSLKEFENSSTHDELWNAAQNEMVRRGKMHGYMRMYWAKKILEWTESPEKAMEIAIYLNDKYELDGRDPNGYTGIAWSIGGVHDRAWFEREVYGKVRYMNANGCKRKFDTKAYIEKWT